MDNVCVEERLMYEVVMYKERKATTEYSTEII